MKYIELEELKNIQINILKYVKKICNENGLRYYLCGGTLLGAIRHKGFIPWDDDIDIFMPIDDYKKFIELFHTNKIDCENYILFDPYSTKRYQYLFSKLADRRTILIENNSPKIENLGVNIDIFPICGLPNEKEERDIFIESLKKSYDKFTKTDKLLWNYSKYRYKSIAKTIIKYPYYLLNKGNNIKDIILKMMEKYDFDESNFVAFYFTIYNIEREITRKQVYSETIDVKFEDDYFSAAIGYDEYLTNLYGDYMKLPPVDKQVTHHDFRAYWR